VVENQQRQQILCKKSPLAERLSDEGLFLAIEFYVFEELFQALFAVLVLDEDINAANLLDASHSLHPEEKLSLFFLLLLIGHALRLVIRERVSIYEVILLADLVVVDHARICLGVRL